jgi:predicted acyltransferase
MNRLATSADSSSRQLRWQWRDFARKTDDAGLKCNPAVSPATHSRAAYARLPTDRASDDGQETAVTSVSGLPDPAAGRVASVDALRGFAMFWIIAGDSLAWALHDLSRDKPGLLSATTGFVSKQLMHASWEGFRFYDLLFPLFLFVTGVSILFSLPPLVERKGKWAAHRRVLRRAALLFLLGLIYYGGTSNAWPDIRLLGVLQRIALCYLFASLLFLHLDARGLVVAFGSLLIGYWAVMTFVPVPEIGAASLEQGTNLVNWIDAQYLPGLKLYGHWDPEGLLSTLPAIGTCLLGVLAGMLLKSMRIAPVQKALWLIGGGIVLVAAGWLWGLQFPVIKNVWTSSFVLVAGGYSALLLGVFYLLMDVRGHKAWSTIFLWFGANAITLYIINNLVGFQGLAGRLVGGDVAKLLNAQLAYGAGSLVIVTVGLVLATVVARFLYRRKIFLRV